MQQYLAGKTERNIAIIRKYTGEEEGVLRKVPWPPMHNDGHLNVESIMQQQAWWVREGWLERVVAPEQFLDARLAQRAFQLLTLRR